MIVDKNIKNIYSGGSKILAVMHKGEIIWGYIKLNIKAEIRTLRGDKFTVVVDGREYELRRRTFTSSKTEFTFMLKVDKKSKKQKYDIRFNRVYIFKDEQGSPEGKKYTVNLDKLERNTIDIIFKS